MWTVLIVGLVILFCGIMLIFSEAFQKKQKVKDAIAIFIMIVGMVVATVGSFVSVYVSKSKIPENYIEFTRYLWYDPSSEQFLRKSNNFIASEDWIPGGEIEFEPCNQPSWFNFCKDCLRAQYKEYCELCGKLLVNICPSCGKECNESYCGTCGVKTTMGG